LMPTCRVSVLPCAARLASGGTAASEGSQTKNKKSKSAGKSSSSGDDAPTDSSKYNVPDYYAHGIYSYYDIDAEAHKFRLPQPSKFSPLVPKK